MESTGLEPKPEFVKDNTAESATNKHNKAHKNMKLIKSRHAGQPESHIDMASQVNTCSKKIVYKNINLHLRQAEITDKLLDDITEDVD